ncbi:MAG: cupin domain-containing protein [Geminicoccaceae bacterium]
MMTNAATGRFVAAGEAPEDVLDWGRTRWLSHPPSTGATQLTVIDVTLKPGLGHDFHHHPDQEEVLLVTAGTVEQWIDQEMRLLGPGDSAFLPAGVVHASFNAGTDEAKIIAILGPCVGDQGYEVVEVGDQEPWSGLRG